VLLLLLLLSCKGKLGIKPELLPLGLKPFSPSS
jgi:hypothetical protein